jgi:methionyl-tRNA synthetase
LLRAAYRLLDETRVHHDVQAINKALDSIWQVVGEANRYFASEQPWSLKVADPQRMGTVLYVTLEVLRQIGILVQPYMPQSAAKLLEALGVEISERSFAVLGEGGRLKPGTTIPDPVPIFPRYLDDAAARTA